MEITGKIIAAMTPRTGTSARTGNTWMTQEFVIETHDQYPRKCVFTVFGEDRLKEMNIQIGAEMTVSFDIDAHEYNGRHTRLACRACTSCGTGSRNAGRRSLACHDNGRANGYSSRCQ